jgi:hypothetical protein
VWRSLSLAFIFIDLFDHPSMNLILRVIARRFCSSPSLLCHMGGGSGGGGVGDLAGGLGSGGGIGNVVEGVATGSTGVEGAGSWRSMKTLSLGREPDLRFTGLLNKALVRAAFKARREADTEEDSEEEEDSERDTDEEEDSEGDIDEEEESEGDSERDSDVDSERDTDEDLDLADEDFEGSKEDDEDDEEVVRRRLFRLLVLSESFCFFLLTSFSFVSSS